MSWVLILLVNSFFEFFLIKKLQYQEDEVSTKRRSHFSSTFLSPQLPNQPLTATKDKHKEGLKSLETKNKPTKDYIDFFEKSFKNETSA